MKKNILLLLVISLFVLNKKNVEAHHSENCPISTGEYVPSSKVNKNDETSGFGATIGAAIGGSIGGSIGTTIGSGGGPAGSFVVGSAIGLVGGNIGKKGGIIVEKHGNKYAKERWEKRKENSTSWRSL